MKTEENVCENENKTGHTASAERENKGSAVLGKFKDVNALLAAYGALEAEFTRRSQRLKALEKEAENLRNESGAVAENAAREAEKPANGKEEVASSVAETIERGDKETLAKIGAGADRAEADDASPHNLEPASKPDFECLNVSESENASESEAEKVEKTESGVAEGKAEEVAGAVGRAFVSESEKDVLKSANEEENKGTKDVAATEEELFRAATTNERVRLKIIGEYLSSLSKPNAPLVRGGTGALVLSPARAKTVEDAGLMALQYFKDGKKRS